MTLFPEFDFYISINQLLFPLGNSLSAIGIHPPLCFTLLDRFSFPLLDFLISSHILKVYSQIFAGLLLSSIVLL
jgi:hypothetical protein